MRKIKGQKGLSLVEVTIMLLVLMLLTSVLAPSFWDFVHDAQWVKVKEDCEAIAISFTRMARDIGPCFRVSASTQCTKANRVDVLISQGATAPTGSDAPAIALTNMTTTNWNAAHGTNREDYMENQFVINTPNYNTPYANYASSVTGYPVGPLFGLGWRGAYLAPPIGPDPWGMAYYVNSGFHATAIDATNTAPGGPGWWWEYDVICVTPGPNQQLDTPFHNHGGTSPTSNYGTRRGNDDFLTVISGSGR